MLVGRHSGRQLAQAGLLVPRDRLGAAAGLGTPLAASLALHLALLAGIGPGGYGSAATVFAGSATVMRVRLAEAGGPLEAPAAQRRAGVTPVAFSGPAPVRYFKSSELDERPTPVELAALVYPEGALASRLRGIVRMRLFISEDGRVERAEVLRASSAQFERAATEAVRQTRFRPGRKDGHAVPSEKLIEVAFDPFGQ